MGQIVVEFFELSGMNISEKLAVLKLVSLCYVQAVVEYDCLGYRLIKFVEVSVFFVIVNIDDEFVYRILREFEILIFISFFYFLFYRQSIKILFRFFKLILLVMSVFVKIEYLFIKLIFFFFSVYVLLKLFIVSDRTFLVFGKFEKFKVVIISYYFIRILVMYYVLGVFFRVGLLIFFYKLKE